MTDGRDDALSCYRKYCMDNLALNNQITPVTTGHVFLVILTTAHVRSNLPIKKAYAGLLKHFKIFMYTEKYTLDCILGLPNVTVITLGTVIGIIILVLLYWGLKFNPKSDS